MGGGRGSLHVRFWNTQNLVMKNRNNLLSLTSTSSFLLIPGTLGYSLSVSLITCSKYFILWRSSYVAARSESPKISFSSVTTFSYNKWQVSHTGYSSSASVKYLGSNFLTIFKLGFEVLTAVVMKSSIFCDIIPCSQLKVSRRFGATCPLHLQGRRISQGRNQRESRCKAALALRAQPFDPEDGGDIFLWNVTWLSTDYTALYPRK
jgi:hypothetical protein